MVVYCVYFAIVYNSWKLILIYFFYIFNWVQYVLRDSSKNSNKEKSPYLLIRKKEDYQLSDNPSSSAADTANNETGIIIDVIDLVLIVCCQLQYLGFFDGLNAYIVYWDENTCVFFHGGSTQVDDDLVDFKLKFFVVICMFLEFSSNAVGLFCWSCL